MNYFDKEEKQYKALPNQEALIDLYVRKKANTIWKSDVASLIDLGDDVVNLEFHSKMNAVGGDTLQAIQHAIDLTEDNYKGLVIANQGQNFSVGANLA